MSDLEAHFDEAMMNIYRSAKTEANYPANRYFQMLTDHGGLETARILLHTGAVSEGYTADAEQECAAFHKKSDRIIKLITVQEILDEQHVQKM